MVSKFVLMFISATIVEIGTNFLEKSDMSIAAGDNIYTELRNQENILCRSCGSDVSSADFLISKLSPSSHYAFNDTLFNREIVLIQVVSHNPIFQFPVITSTESICQGYGEWEVDNSWFPGYRWKLCICPECGEFLGRIFESVYHGNHQESPHEVFCLVLTSVIGESCNYIFLIQGLCGKWLCYKFIAEVSYRLLRTMTSSDNLSEQDKQFLASCEELLKDRYTENDEAFMKVFKAAPSQPPILESWWVPNNGGRRNDRRFNRRHQLHYRDGRDGDGQSRARADYSRGPRHHDGRSYTHSDRPRYY